MTSTIFNEHAYELGKTFDTTATVISPTSS